MSLDREGRDGSKADALDDELDRLVLALVASGAYSPMAALVHATATLGAPAARRAAGSFGKVSLTAQIGVPSDGDRRAAPGRVTRTMSMAARGDADAVADDAADDADADLAAIAGRDQAALDDLATAPAVPGSQIAAVAGLAGRVGENPAAIDVVLGRPDLTAPLDTAAVAVGARMVFADASPDAELVAHELVHVAQARRASGSPATRVSRPGSPAEVEAEALAGRLLAGGHVTASARPDAVAHRDLPRGGDRMPEFMEFIQSRQAAINAMSPGTEQDTQEEILRRFIAWVRANMRRLGAVRPIDQYEAIGRTVITPQISAQIDRERRAPQDQASRAAKLEEFWALAQQLWGYRARTLRSIEIPAEHRAIIIQENQATQDVLSQMASDLMEHAYGRYAHAGFTGESALAALSDIAGRPLYRAALLLAQSGPLDSESVRIPVAEQPLWQAAVDVLIGFIPVIGDISDLTQALGGVDLWGNQLGLGDRGIMMVGAIIPLVPGSALRRGRDATEFAVDLARSSGRHVDEVLPLVHAADSMRRADIQRIQSAVDLVRRRQPIPADRVDELREILDRVSRDLRAPLAGATRRGTRELVEFTEEAIEHVGVRHVPEMFDPVAALRSLNQQGIMDPTHITHMFRPGTIPSDRQMTTLMRQILESREAASTAGRVIDVTIRGTPMRLVTGAGPGGVGVRVVSLFPTGGVGVTRRQIETWATDLAAGRTTLERVREQLRALF